jgi:alpha 1,3-glucosidase
MREDPYTLVVTLDKDSKAEGKLYLDDQTSYDFQRKGLYRLRSFTYAPEGSCHVLRSTLAGGNKAYAQSNTVERIIVAGLGRSPKAVLAKESGDAQGRSVSFTYDAEADVLVIRKPEVKAAYDWTCTLDF